MNTGSEWKGWYAAPSPFGRTNFSLRITEVWVRYRTVLLVLCYVGTVYLHGRFKKQKKTYRITSHQCCGSEIGGPVSFWSLDPGSGAFLTPGSGIRYNKSTMLPIRIHIRGPVPFWPPDPGPFWPLDPGSGIGKKNQDPDPGWTSWIIIPRAWKQFSG